MQKNNGKHVHIYNQTYIITGGEAQLTTFTVNHQPQSTLYMRISKDLVSTNSDVLWGWMLLDAIPLSDKIINWSNTAEK